MKQHDLRGLGLSTDNPKSVECLEKALDLTASYFVDPLATIESALQEDPSFVMGHCLKAALGVMCGEKGGLLLIDQSLRAIEQSGRANSRERAHAAAAAAWLEGDFARTNRLYGEILHDHPRDLLALQAAHITNFLLGNSQLLRDRVAQVLPHWDDSVSGHGYVLGMYAFGLEETGLYARAQQTGLRALELSRRDPWAVHAVTHTMEMQGLLREGIDFLSYREPDWAPNNGFAFHNYWHLALFHLDLGEHERALAIYDQHVRPRPTQMALENIDASALLWRLELRGADVGARWQALADGWEGAAEDAFYAFNDVHALIAFIGAGREDLVAKTQAALVRAAERGGTNGMMTRDVGLPLARALLAFSRGDFSTAVELLLEVRTIAHRFGGSHAQRDLIHLTLVEATLRAGKSKLARALSAERTALKPSNPFNWRLTARALELDGDRSGAGAARARSTRGAALQVQ
jgi:tetratricopeptide (TPR) repeat protein